MADRENCEIDLEIKSPLSALIKRGIFKQPDATSRLRVKKLRMRAFQRFQINIISKLAKNLQIYQLYINPEFLKRDDFVPRDNLFS